MGLGLGLGLGSGSGLEGLAMRPFIRPMSPWLSCPYLPSISSISPLYLPGLSPFIRPMSPWLSCPALPSAS